MSSVNERSLEHIQALETGLSNPESNIQQSLNGSSLEIADYPPKSGLPEPVKEKNIIQEKIFSFEKSSVSSELNVSEEHNHTDKSTNELCLQEMNSLTVIQDKDVGHNAFEGDVPVTNVRCSLKGDEIPSGQKCEISPGQISPEDNQTSIVSNLHSDCCPSACDETLHQKSSEQSSPKTDKTLISSSPPLSVPDCKLISSDLPDDLANTSSGLMPALSVDEAVMNDLPDASSTQSSSSTEFPEVSAGHADLVNELIPHTSDASYSSNNNNLPHKKLCSYISEPSTESLLPEPSNGFPDVSDFQPLILDVRGSCNENLLDCPTDIQETNNSNANCVTQQVEGKDKFLDTMESIPKSAMEMLRGIMQLNQINQSKTIPEAHVISNSANSSQEMVTEETESVITKPGCSNSLLQNGTPDSAFNLLSQVANNKVDGSDQVATQVASLTSFPLTAEHASQHPHMITVNRIPVTCVLVQDTNSVSSNKVTLVIAKPGLLKPRNALGAEDSNKNRQILPAGSATDNASNETIINAENSVPSSPTKMTTIKERVANLVDKTIEKFVMKGRDLENSSILKIPSDTELKAMTHSNSSVQCSVCGEIYHNNVSLSNHLGRTVFNLLYECPICKIGIVFYNKCALWKHLRNHCKTLQYNNILQFKPYDFKTNQTEEIELVSTADIASLHTRDKTADHISISKMRTLPLLPTICGLNTLEQGRSECLLKCSMCNLVHLQVTQIQSPQVSVDKTLIQSCPSCGMFLPSLCSFRAHIRLHSKAVNNMICPECGHITLKNSLSLDDMKKAAFDHMDECKHFNRVVVLSCFCKEEFMLVKQLAHHFINKHLQTLFKCKFCLLAFTQHEHLLNHIKILHQNQYFAIEPSGIHVLCTYCQQLLKNPNEAKSHVETHVLNQKHKAVFKWKCFLCSKVLENKEKLSEHSDREHPHKPKRCMICFSLFCSRQNLVDHIMLKKCKQSTPMIYDQCVDIEQNLQLPDLNYFKLFMVPGSDNGPSKATVGSLNRKFIRIAPKELSKLNDSNCETEKSTSGPRDPSSQEQCMITETPVCLNPNLGIQKNVSASGKMTAVQRISINPGKKLTLTGTKSTTLMQTCQESPESQLESTFTVRKNIKKVFSCQVCQQKFAARNYYNSHMRAHEKKGEWNPNEKCDVCEMRLETSFLETHLKEHQAEGVVICSSCQSREFQDMEGALKHPDTGCALTRNTGLTSSTQPCQKEMSEIPDEPCKTNISQVVEKGVHANAINAEKNKEEEETSVFPCLLCGLAFHTLAMRENHVSRLHDGTRIVYQCLKCKKKKMSKVIFSKKESVVRHLIKRHRILKMDSVEKFIGIEEQNASSGHSLQQTESVDSDDSSDPPPKRLRIAENGDYMCGKCGFLTTDSGEFCKHIATHNANNEPQCPECGLCFTVLPALMKHLFAVHKIRAVEEFLKSKNIKMPEFEADEPMEDAVFPVPTSPESYSNLNRHRSSPQNPLECTVCYKVLESELNLKTHMRNHGMAFIRSKRLQNIDDPGNKD